jgi:hypothetical protein
VNFNTRVLRDYGRRDPSRLPRGTLYPQKLALTSSTSGSRSVGIVRSRTQATEFVLFLSTQSSGSKSKVRNKTSESDNKLKDMFFRNVGISLK